MQSRDGVVPTPRPLIRRMGLHTNSGNAALCNPIIPFAGLSGKGGGLDFCREAPGVWTHPYSLRFLPVSRIGTARGDLPPPGPIREDNDRKARN